MTEPNNNVNNAEKVLEKAIVYIPTCPSNPLLRQPTQEERIKGGLARTEKKRIANKLKTLKQKKCKHCTLGCPVRNSNLEKDFEHRCAMPEAHQLILKMGSDPEIIAQKLKHLLIDMDELGAKSKFLKDKKIVYDAHIEFKKEFCPVTTTIKHEGKLDMSLNDILRIAQSNKEEKEQENKKDGDTTAKPSENPPADTK